MKKVVGATLATLVLGALGLEAVARTQDLDRKQYQGIAVDNSRLTSRGPWRDGASLDVPYLPAGVAWDGVTLETPYGTCSAGQDGRTILIFGDSTTVQSDVPTPDNPGAKSWPHFIHWPDDAQVCGVAAEGYHPADYARMLEQLGPVLDPDLIVVLLCDNDLGNRMPRIAAPVGDGMLGLFEPPSHTVVYPPLWQPTLYEASEAFRFVHWRLALSTGNVHELPLESEAVVTASDAMTQLAEADATLFVRLPPLAGSAAQSDLLAAFEVRDIELPADTRPYRRTPDDRVHLNEAGHEHIAPQLQAWIDAALDDGA